MLIGHHVSPQPSNSCTENHFWYRYSHFSSIWCQANHHNLSCSSHVSRPLYISWSSHTSLLLYLSGCQDIFQFTPTQEVSEECVLAFTAANNKFPLWVSLSQDTFTAFSMCSLFLIIFLRKQISADSSTELTHTQNHSLKYNQNQTV